MRPKWIKIGDPAKDLFDIIDLLKQGESIYDIAKSDNSISVTDIRDLLIRTSKYLKNHLILDSYLKTVNKLSSVKVRKVKLEWTAEEIHELVNLHLFGAKTENIALLMRKDKSEVCGKLKSLNLMKKEE